jgi:predicted nucleotidyltransferase
MLTTTKTEQPDKLELAEKVLHDLVDVARVAFADNLIAALVFGSAADGTLRVTSDVNLMLVLKQFTQIAADQLRDSLRLARATVGLQVMFAVEAEIPFAAKYFALKFSDIKARHRVLYGNNPLESITIDDEDLAASAKQALLNFQLRTREQYVLVSLREEQLVNIIADAAAPLRTCAVALRRLRGESFVTAKEALEIFVSNLKAEHYSQALQHMSEARETAHLTPGTAAQVLMSLLSLSHLLYEQLN